MFHRAFQVVLVAKNLTANTGDIRDAGLIPELGRSLGEQPGNLLQYSCLENPRDRGAWQTIVNRVTKNQREMKWLNMHRYPRHPRQQEKSHTKGFSNLLHFHSIIVSPFPLCLLCIPLLTTFPLVVHHLAYFFLVVWFYFVLYQPFSSAFEMTTPCWTDFLNLTLCSLGVFLCVPCPLSQLHSRRDMPGFSIGLMVTTLLYLPGVWNEALWLICSLMWTDN